MGLCLCGAAGSVPWGYFAVPLLAGLTLLAGLVLARPREICQRLDRDDILLCAALLAYGGLWLGDVWRTGNWPVGEGNQGVLLPLWPLLAAALLVWLRRFPPPVQTLWWATGCGALGAGSIALYERLLLSQARASNAMNAIPFGDLSLLLGAISLMGALWCLGHDQTRRRVLLTLNLLGAAAGLTGSLLSGTRGGWIALPLLLLLAWRAGARLFPERPLAGWGEGRLEVERDRLVAQGKFPPGISRYDQLHNDIIDTAARRGLLGLGTLLLLYGAPLWLFWRHLAVPRRDPTLGVLATAGMMVPVAFIDFGLTQSMLRDVRGLSGYLGLCVICWAVLRQAEERRGEQPIDNAKHVQDKDISRS